MSVTSTNSHTHQVKNKENKTYGTLRHDAPSPSASRVTQQHIGAPRVAPDRVVSFNAHGHNGPGECPYKEANFLNTAAERPELHLNSPSAAPGTRRGAAEHCLEEKRTGDVEGSNKKSYNRME